MWVGRHWGAPSDWILIQPGSPGTENIRTRSWYKVAQSGEAGPYTFTSTRNADVILHIATFYESTAVNVTGWIVEDSSYVYSGTNAASITTGSVTGVANGLLYASFGNSDNNTVSTAPSGMTNLDAQTQGGKVALASYYEFRGAGGGD